MSMESIALSYHKELKKHAFLLTNRSQSSEAHQLDVLLAPQKITRQEACRGSQEPEEQNRTLVFPPQHPCIFDAKALRYTSYICE